jgi:hypothetical protein
LDVSAGAVEAIGEAAQHVYEHHATNQQLAALQLARPQNKKAASVADHCHDDSAKQTWGLQHRPQSDQGDG